MNQKNQGFTLIELIVTVAIIAIFSGVVVSVVGTGSHSYRTTSSNAKVQMETQDIMDQIQNIIIDVNRSVYYSYGDGMNDSVGELVTNDIETAGTATAKTFFATSGTESSNLDESGNKLYDYTCDVILWNKQEQKLYYACRTWQGTETEKTIDTANDVSDESGIDDESTPSDIANQAGTNDEVLLDITDSDMEVADGSEGESEGTIVSKRTSKIEKKVEKTLLAENVTDFRVDVSKAASERIVRFQFTANVNGKETTTVHAVNLRNQIQVSKPYEGYNKSDSDTPWLLLTNYPEEVEPGKSVTGFSKLMNGNIDPDTVKWVVDSGNGAFTAGAEGYDDSLVTLTVNSDAKDGDLITIHVEAQTSDGKKVQSRTATIKVVNVKVPQSLTPSTTELLLGVNNTYDLKDIVKWSIQYTDTSEEEVQEDEQLTWELESNISGISLDGSTGRIEIQRDELGTGSGNSVFKINVSTEKDGKEIKGSVNVKLARVDIVNIVPEYSVGQKKPIDYEYKEGGQIATASETEIIYTHDNQTVSTEDYKKNECFNQNDAGNWTMKVVVKVGEKTVTDQKEFIVKEIAQECEIGGKDIIIAGNPYRCSYWKHNNFYPKFELKEGKTWNFEITWKITGESDQNTAFPDGLKTITNNDLDLSVGSQEHGFILEAFVKVFDGGTGIVAETYHGSKNIKVITQSDVVMENPVDIETNQAVENYTVIKGRSYIRPWSIYAWQYNSSTGEHSRIELNSLTEYNIKWSSAEGWDAENKIWNVPLKTAISSQNLIMYVEINDDKSELGGKDIMPPNKYYSFQIPKTITVSDPQTTIELLDNDNNTSSEIFADDKVTLTAYTTANGKEFSPDSWRWTWNCLDMDTNQQVYNVLETADKNLNNKFIFTVPSVSNQKEAKRYKITASFDLYDNDIVDRKAEYIVTVKPYTVKAEIVAIDNKTSLFPGDTTQLYLRLKTEKGVMDGTASWTPDNWQYLYFNGNNYQGTIYDGKEIPITIVANSSIKSVTKTSISVDYNLKSRFSYQGKISIDLMITPLTLNLTSSTDQIYYGGDSAIITADIVDAEHDKHVTDEYDIEWSLTPVSEAIYDLVNATNATAQLSVKAPPETSTAVTVNAVAKEKKSGTVVCTAAKIVTVNPKTTIEKAYSCPVSYNQKLEFNSADAGKEIQNIKTGYFTSTGNELTECAPSKLPILSFDSENMTIQMNDEAENFGLYKYVKIAVDFADVLYNFYIYPLQNNVYDCEYNQNSGVEPFMYVPADFDSIRKLCTLDGDNYTYKYPRADMSGKYCEIRMSVYAKTGIGSFKGNYAESSANKWFMRLQYRDGTGLEWRYYRLEGNKWYQFHNGDKSESDKVEKAKITRFYWTLNQETYLYDDNGIELEDQSPVENTYFWRKWS